MLIIVNANVIRVNVAVQKIKTDQSCGFNKQHNVFLTRMNNTK